MHELFNDNDNKIKNLILIYYLYNIFYLKNEIKNINETM